MKQFTMIVCLCIAISLLIVGICGIGLFDILMAKIFSMQTVLSAESSLYKQWLATSFPIYVQFFFFNLTNPTAFEAGEKPVVSQIGPYTYREIRFKTNVSMDNASGRITYKEVKQYVFDENSSIGPESDEMTSINLGYISIANASKAYSWLKVKLIIVTMTAEGYKLCARHSVKETLWGYDDPVLRFLHNFDPSVSTRVGLYLDKNNTDDGFVTINSGMSNPVNVGDILKYHGKPTLSCWTTPEANMINGSDGSLFHSLLRDGETIDIFSADICRSIRFFPASQEYMKGIPVTKYLPMENTFDSANKAPQNRGFCLNWTNCPKDGVMELSTCKPNAPIVVSWPHLTHADASYQSAVVGLDPSEEFNTTFMIQPTLGAVLRVAQKLQLNAVVKQNNVFEDLANVKDVFLPIVFLNESVHVDEMTAIQIWLLLLTPPLVVHVTGTILIVLVAIAIRVVLYLYYLGRRRTPSDQQALNDVDVSEIDPLIPNDH